MEYEEGENPFFKSCDSALPDVKQDQPIVLAGSSVTSLSPFIKITATR
jgi:hypothetical protein